MGGIVEIILNCTQVAAWLHRSEATVKKMVKQKQIPSIKCGKRILFIVSELEDWFFHKAEISDQYRRKTRYGAGA